MQYLKPEGHPPLKFWQFIIWRWFATMTAYFFLSLAYSLIFLAFQINFSSGYQVPETAVSGRVNRTAYGDGTFLVYWMINYFGMIALGLACENVPMVIRPAVVGAVAHLLGHHERQHGVLQHRHRAGVLSVGLRVAAA